METTAAQPKGRLVVFTGAGLSADSGIPTFRDADGLWEKHNINDVCNILTWKMKRDVVHRFYSERRKAMADATPNAAHAQIAAWQRRYATTIITQNVDDLLERAGCTSVIHVHGRLWEMQCLACGHVWTVRAAWTADDRCPRCSSRKGVKPNVVFFNEQAPLYRAMFKTFKEAGPDDVLVVIGTSGEVLPIGAYAQMYFRCRILNNLEPPKVISMAFPGVAALDPDQFDHVVWGRAAETTDSLDRLVVSYLGEGSAQ